jgi:hypothetical protein
MTTPQSPEIDMEAVREEEERKSEGFRLIDAFIFNFSQLEFTIRARLATALHHLMKNSMPL